MNTEEFLKKRKERKKKVKRRIIIVGVVIGAIWIPCTLWLHKPEILF